MITVILIAVAVVALWAIFIGQDWRWIPGILWLLLCSLWYAVFGPPKDGYWPGYAGDDEGRGL